MVIFAITGNVSRQVDHGLVIFFWIWDKNRFPVFVYGSYNLMPSTLINLITRPVKSNLMLASKFDYRLIVQTIKLKIEFLEWID